MTEQRADTRDERDTRYPRDGGAVRPEYEEKPPGPDEGVKGPTDLSKRSVWAALKNTAKEFGDDNLSDWAAALTYYSVLSIFPGLLVLFSLIGLLGADTANELRTTLEQLTPGAVHDLVNGIITNVQEGSGAGLLAIFGLLGALWSASGYVGAFMRASNAIYDVPEGRPVWKTLPIRLGTTVAVGVMLGLSAFSVVLTGRIAERVGGWIGLGETAVTVWNIAKWPVLVVVVSLIFALLYWVSPNARQGGFRWISPGGLVAVVLWLAASGAFAVYLANFASYDKTYGTLGGVIAFLVWLWISNLAILFGAELDAELERRRAVSAGHPEDDEPYLQLRDDRKVKPGSDQGLS